MKFILILLPLLFFSSHSYSTDKAWAEFLTSPNQVRHESLANALEKCSDSICIKNLAPSSVDVENLLVLVRKGDLRGIDIAFLSIRFLDGGDLEDVYREIGMLSETSPKLFLIKIKNRHVTAYQMQRMLRMLPLDTVDDIRSKRRIVKSRIEHLSIVDNPELKDVRNKSIGILKQYLIRLR
jgi:hypothetical protein